MKLNLFETTKIVQGVTQQENRKFTKFLNLAKKLCVFCWMWIIVLALLVRVILAK